MIVNIRGTSGSGKSTIARQIMRCYGLSKEVTQENLATYVDVQLELKEGRKRPLGYVSEFPSDRPRLFVVGHYETACGGCDTIAEKQFDNVYALVRAFSDAGYDVLYEGLLISAESARAIQLKQDGYDVHVFGLDTDRELCLAGIRERRKEKGGEKAEAPFAESVFKNLDAKRKGTEATLKKLETAGVSVVRGSREQVFDEIVKALNLKP